MAKKESEETVVDVNLADQAGTVDVSYTVPPTEAPTYPPTPTPTPTEAPTVEPDISIFGLKVHRNVVSGSEAL